VPEDDTRTLADDRRRLFARMELERNQLMRNIETCRIRDIDRPFIDRWSLKDIVGHVISWEAEFVTALREHAAGKRPQLSDFDHTSIDQWNEDHVERTRGLNFWSLLEQLHSGRERFLEALSSFSDEELTDGLEPNRLAVAALEHDREHWHEIAARLAGMAGVRVSESTTAS
jgi:hypothetical protein